MWEKETSQGWLLSIGPEQLEGIDIYWEYKAILSPDFKKKAWVVNINLGEVTIEMVFKDMRIMRFLSRGEVWVLGHRWKE